MPNTEADYQLDLMHMIEEAASKLQRNMAEGYTQGYEYTLADDINKKLVGDGQRKGALRYLVTEHLIGWPLTGGALDEADQESYDLMAEFAGRITDLGCRQMQAYGSDVALRSMLAAAICDLERALRTEQEWKASNS